MHHYLYQVPVTNLFREQLLDISALPLRLVCHSPSFRAEAGSYGKDTRGLLRQHQFHKVRKFIDFSWIVRDEITHYSIFSFLLRWNL